MNNLNAGMKHIQLLFLLLAVQPVIAQGTLSSRFEMETLPGNDTILIYRDTLTGRVGLSSRDGHLLTLAVYDEIGILDGSSSILLVTKGDFYGLLHISGRELLPPGEHYIQTAEAPGYFIISSFNGNLGVFHNGRMIIPAEYEEDISFSLRSDSSGRQWVDFIRGFQRVRRYQSIVLFDSAGRVLNSADTEGKLLFELETSGWSGYYELRDRKLRGVYHVHRGIVVPARYEYFEEVSTADGEPMYFIVERKGRYGLYDGYGEQILPAVYRFIEPIFGTNSLFQAADAEGRVIEVLPDYSIREVPDEN
jgi:hypothetical protein